jgi:hypothetical protein
MTGAVERVWIPDRDWRVPSRYTRCRRRLTNAHSQGLVMCPNPPVADLNRAHGANRSSWWAYCALHLYGRRVVGDAVLISVNKDSPAAERGSWSLR